MNCARSIPIALLIMALAAQLALTACTPAGAAEKDEPLTVPVQVAPVETGDIAAVLSYAGNLQPTQEVEVSAGTTDKVVDLRADVGDVVHQGDVLIAFDTATLEIQSAQAQGALSAAEAQLAKMKRGTRPEQVMAAQAALNLAQANLSGVDTASDAQIETAAGGVAQAQAALKLAQAEYDKVSWAGQAGMLPQSLALEQSTVAYETAMANYNAVVKGAPVERLALEASLLQAQSALALANDPFVPEDFVIAEAAVQQARSALELAQTQSDRANVESPIDGIVAARHVSLGETPSPGMPLFTLVSVEVEVILAVEEGRIGDVHVGQPAAIRVVAYPGRDFPAVVSSVSPTADPKTHTFTLKISPEDDDSQLKGGMFADVSLLTEEHTGALLIPRSAVRRADNDTTVFVVQDGQATARPVTLGLEQGDKVEVLAGLTAGEDVVVAGQAALSDGSRVAVDEVIEHE